MIYLYDGLPEHADADIVEHRSFQRGSEHFADREVVVAGLSAQTPRDQYDTAVAARICHVMFADPDLELARALGVPAIVNEHTNRYRRITLVMHNRTVAAVLSVSTPSNAAGQVLTWMTLRYSEYSDG